MKKSPLTQQYKWNPFTGQVYLVGSKASDKPVKEQQPSLFAWAKDTARLEEWKKDAKDKE